MGWDTSNLAGQRVQQLLQGKARPAPEICGRRRSFGELASGRRQLLPGERVVFCLPARCLLPLPLVKGLMRAWGEEVSAARRTLESGRGNDKVLGEARRGPSATSTRSAAKLVAPRPKTSQERAENGPRGRKKRASTPADSARVLSGERAERARKRPNTTGGPGPSYSPSRWWGLAPQPPHARMKKRP